MAGIFGKSGPPGNQNGFRHGLAAIHNRRAEGALTENGRDIRTEILAGLIADTSGEGQISTATRILAEIIARDAAWLFAVNRAMDGVMASNQKARNNPNALHTRDGYKRGVVNSLAGNLQRFGFERLTRTETLQEIIEEMGAAETKETASTDSSLRMFTCQPCSPPQSGFNNQAG
jgi:hypothetical protein